MIQLKRDVAENRARREQDVLIDAFGLDSDCGWFYGENDDLCKDRT